MITTSLFRARSREKRRAEGPEVQPVCKALGYWDDKSEEKILRTTTDGWSKMTRSHMGIPPNFSFFANFNFLKNLVKLFSWIHIVFTFYSFEKFSLIHDRHTSVSRWGHFLDYFFFFIFFNIYKLKFSRNYKLSFSCNLNNLFCSSILKA